MCFIISHTPTRAYNRLPPNRSVVNTFDELMVLQDELECDLYITMPDEYNQRHVMFSDPL
jgi:hypothetical protein